MLLFSSWAGDPLVLEALVLCPLFRWPFWCTCWIQCPCVWLGCSQLWRWVGWRPYEAEFRWSSGSVRVDVGRSRIFLLWFNWKVLRKKIVQNPLGVVTEFPPARDQGRNAFGSTHDRSLFDKHTSCRRCVLSFWRCSKAFAVSELKRIQSIGNVTLQVTNARHMFTQVVVRCVFILSSLMILIGVDQQNLSTGLLVVPFCFLLRVCPY